MNSLTDNWFLEPAWLGLPRALTLLMVAAAGTWIIWNLIHRRPTKNLAAWRQQMTTAAHYRGGVARRRRKVSCWAFAGIKPDGRPIGVPVGSNLLIVAPPNSGKTTGVLAPTVLGTNQPTITTSVRADLAQMTTPALQANRVPVAVLSGSAINIEGTTDVWWNPLGWLDSFPLNEQPDRADWLADQLTKFSDPPNEGYSGGTGGHFRATAAPVISAIFLAAQQLNQRLDELAVANLITADGITALHTDTDLSPLITRRLASAASAGDNERGSIGTTAARALGPWMTRPPAPHWTGFNTNGPTVLHLVQGSLPEEHAAILFGAILTVAAEDHRRRWNNSSRTSTEGRMTWLLDEAPNLARLPDLARRLSTSDGEGINIAVACQHTGQLEQRWGRTSNIATLCQTALVWGHLGGNEPLYESFRKAAGTKLVSITEGKNQDGTDRTRFERQDKITIDQLNNLGRGAWLATGGQVRTKVSTKPIQKRTHRLRKVIS